MGTVTDCNIINNREVETDRTITQTTPLIAIVKINHNLCLVCVSVSWDHPEGLLKPKYVEVLATREIYRIYIYIYDDLQCKVGPVLNQLSTMP
jgi:hypothetical protein